MCGRFACCLEPGTIQKACSCLDPKTGKYMQPEWREHPSAGDPDAKKKYQYFPSVNMAPSQFTPVMFRNGESRVLQPMLWGLIPPWHEGDPKTHKYSTFNARLEGLERSRLFRRAVVGKQFCAVVAQGFYEWTKADPKKKLPKQPYLLFMKQSEGIDVVGDEKAWKSAQWSDDEGWKGPKILYMAGLYDVWHSPTGEMVCSYTIITRDPSEELKWLHPRLPAILETPEQLHAWLNPDPEADISELLNILQPATALEWYPVHPKVGNWRCQDQDCIKRYEFKEPPPTAVWTMGDKKKQLKLGEEEKNEMAKVHQKPRDDQEEDTNPAEKNMDKPEFDADQFFDQGFVKVEEVKSETAVKAEQMVKKITTKPAKKNVETVQARRGQKRGARRGNRESPAPTRQKQARAAKKVTAA